jgi:DNA-binding HxlR family transcriptional regulator
MIRPTPSKYGPPPSGCPVTEGLSFLSTTWTPDIFWFLRGEPRRFGDLKRDLAGISAKVLTDRLRELERHGVVQRTIKATSPETVE